MKAGTEHERQGETGSQTSKNVGRGASLWKGDESHFLPVFMLEEESRSRSRVGEEGWLRHLQTCAQLSACSTAQVSNGLLPVSKEMCIYFQK